MRIQPSVPKMKTNEALRPYSLFFDREETQTSVLKALTA
jgi:hypothetical protein